MIVVAQDVVDVHRGWPAGGLRLAGEVLQHLRLALVGPGPLAVATDVPDDIVGQVLVHPGSVASLHRLEALPDDGDVGMLVPGHDRFLSAGGPLTWSTGDGGRTTGQRESRQ
jgi:hypothetical protein